MSGSSQRYWEVFFDVYEHLPRQGPGNRESAARALALCDGLPPAPAILDLGGGAGAQTLHLAELTGGSIVALDSHPPLVAEAQRRIAARGFAGRITARVGDMAAPPAAPGSTDLIWCEGAAYFLGIEQALGLWQPLLRTGGHLVFTEAVWLRSDPPAEVRSLWSKEYPAMTDVASNLALIARVGGYELRGHFTLPELAWWDDFYTPMDRRIAASATATATSSSCCGRAEPERVFRRQRNPNTSPARTNPNRAAMRSNAVFCSVAPRTGASSPSRRNCRHRAAKARIAGP